MWPGIVRQKSAKPSRNRVPPSVRTVQSTLKSVVRRLRADRCVIIRSCGNRNVLGTAVCLHVQWNRINTPTLCSSGLLVFSCDICRVHLWEVVDVSFLLDEPLKSQKFRGGSQFTLLIASLTNCQRLDLFVRSRRERRVSDCFCGVWWRGVKREVVCWRLDRWSTIQQTITSVLPFTCSGVPSRILRVLVLTCDPWENPRLWIMTGGRATLRSSRVRSPCLLSRDLFLSFH